MKGVYVMEALAAEHGGFQAQVCEMSIPGPWDLAEGREIGDAKSLHSGQW